MIRQIVVEQDHGRPDQVGVLLASSDLTDEFMAGLAARIVRAEWPNLGHVSGCGDGVRWRWLPMDGETPGLEYHTLRVPRPGPAYQKYPPSAMTGLLPNPRPCDRVPWWLWPAAAAVVIGLIAAGVR